MHKITMEAREGMYKKQFGRWGERMAVDYLRARGFTIHATNFFTRFGELDVVAEKNGVLYFFEVKTRMSRSLGTFESVHGLKRLHFYRAIKLYCQAKKIPEEQPCQWMVMTIVGSGAHPHIEMFQLDSL